ncbi:MAG: M56 family metallopeptidase [Rikenellaceae bacterium]|nr:M56 family metallopeptidase [Rikenellaceae bacterium]
MSVTLYILEFVLCSAVFVALYKLFIEGRVSYRYSRIYLVLSMVFSAVVPMLELPLYPAQTIYYELPIITYEQPVEILPSADIVSPSEPMPEPEQQPIDWGKVAGIVAASIYGLIVMLNLARFAWRLWLIRKLRRRCELTIYEAYTLALSDHISEPFSFWRTVYMNRHLQGRERQHILTHELSHVSHHHTAERLTLELMRCVFWFNPFVWIAGSLLVQVQEWQADKDVIDAGYDVYEYRNFIFRQLYGVGPEVDLTSGLHSKLTKKRFLMMTDFKKGRFQLLRMVASVPVMAAMILAFGAVKAEDKIVYSNPSQSVESEFATDQMENDAVVQDTTQTKSSVQIKFSTGVIPPEPQEKRIILNRGTYEVMSCAFTSAQYNKISPNVVITVLNDTEMEIKSQGDWKLVESGRYSYMLTPKRLSLTSADGKYTFDAKFAGPMFKSTLKLHTPNDAKISRLDFVGPKETRDSTVAIGFKDGNVYLNGKQTTLKELDEVHHFDFDAEAQDENGKPTTLLDILRKGTNKPIRQEAVADSDVASVELSPSAQAAAKKAVEQPRPIIRMQHEPNSTVVDIFLEGEKITISELQKVIATMGDAANKTYVFSANSTYLQRTSQYSLDLQKIIKESGAKYEFGKSLSVIGGKRGKRVGPTWAYENDGKLHTELNDEVRAILNTAGISEREFLESQFLFETRIKSEYRILVCKFGIYFNEARYYNMQMFEADLATLKKNDIMRPIKFYVQEGADEGKVAEVKDILSSLDLLSSTPVEHTTTYGFNEMPIVLIDFELATPEQLAKLSPDEISSFIMETQMQPHTPRLLQLTPYTEADFEKRKIIRVEYKTHIQARDGKLYLNDKEMSVAEYVKLNKGYYSDKNIAHAKSFSDEQKAIWIHYALLQSPSTMVHRISQGGDPKACKNLASSKLSEQAVIYLSNGYNVEVAEAVKEALMDNRRVKVISIVDSEGKGEVICKDVDGQTVTLKCNRKHRMSKPTYDKIVATISGEDLLLVDGFKMNLAEFRRHISEYGEYRTKIRIITDSAKGMTKEQVMTMAEQLRDELIMSNVVKDVKFVTRKTAETESAPVDLEKCAKSGDITVGDYFSYGVMTKDEPVWDPNKIPQPKIRQILQMVPVINVADDDTIYVLNRTPKNIIESGKYKYTYANGVLTLKGDKEYQFPYELEYIPGKYETLLLKLRLDKKINDVEVEMISLSL